MINETENLNINNTYILTECIICRCKQYFFRIYEDFDKTIKTRDYNFYGYLCLCKF